MTVIGGNNVSKKEKPQKKRRKKKEDRQFANMTLITKCKNEHRRCLRTKNTFTCQQVTVNLHHVYLQDTVVQRTDERSGQKQSTLIKLHGN